MHLYSRWPLEQPETAFLVEENVPSIHARVRLPSGAAVRLHLLHPAPPSPQENTLSSERDAELMVVARSLEGSEEAVIVAGDLNDTAWSRTTRLFLKLSGLLDQGGTAVVFPPRDCSRLGSLEIPARSDTGDADGASTAAERQEARRMAQREGVTAEDVPRPGSDTASSATRSNEAD